MLISKLQKLREEREEGFTLIELLVVILIIGILSAIAIPAFMNQRKAAVDSSVQADLTSVAKEIATQETKTGGQLENVIVKTDTATQEATVTVGTVVTKIKLSKGNSVAGVFGTLGLAGSTDGYSIKGTNPNGDRAVTGFTWNTSDGGAQW